MSNRSTAFALPALFVLASTAAADVTRFLASDGERLYRGDLNGNVDPYITLSVAVQSLTRVPEGFAIAGASAGDIIATAVDAVSGSWGVYRLDDPFGQATLTQIGSTSFSVGSIAFTTSEIYAVNASAAPIRVSRLDTTSFATLQTYSTGVNTAGGGGIAYNPASSEFYITDATNNRLLRWGPGGNATVIGGVGVGFSNNGLEFLNGTLYGALRLDSPGSQMRVGTFDTATGAFTAATTITGILGNGTGFVTIPTPASAAAFAMLAIRAATRRRTR